MSEIKQRTLTGFLFAGTLAVGTVASGWTFLLILLLITIFGLIEYCSLFSTERYRPDTFWVVLVGVAVFILTQYHVILFEVFSMKTQNKYYLLLPIFILPLVFILFIIELYNRKEWPFQRASVGVIGIMYIPVSLSYFSGIAYMVDEGGGGEYSPYLALCCLLLIWASDTFAYFSGYLFGKTKLFPTVSPKKTWEGFIGGLICTIIASIGMFYVFPGILQMWQWMGLAVVFVVFGLWGDLIQSMLKRSLEIKDSGKILPGHGGILDRFDSLLFSVPFAAAYLYFAV